MESPKSQEIKTKEETNTDITNTSEYIGKKVMYTLTKQEIEDLKTLEEMNAEPINEDILKYYKNPKSFPHNKFSPIGRGIWPHEKI